MELLERKHKDRVSDLSFALARTSISKTRIGTGHDAWVDAQNWFILGNEYMDFIEFLQDELGRNEVSDLQEKFFKLQAKSQLKALKKFRTKPAFSKQKRAGGN